MNKYFTLLALVVVLGSGCSKYGYVRLKYPLAPQAYLPGNIHTIALANRSLVNAGDESKATAEAIATGEVAGSDKVASEECLKAVFDQMNGYKGLNIVLQSHSQLTGTGTRTIPALLDWQQVKLLCDSSHADALLVLEMFDSNSDLVVG